MPRAELRPMLGQFEPSSYTVKLCSTVFGAVPGMEPFVFYDDLEGALTRLAPGDADVRARAMALATSEDVETAVWVADNLDTLDVGLGIYAGVRNLLSWIGVVEDSRRTFEADAPQATDAVAKALGLAYMIHLLYPGSPGEKLEGFKSTPAAKELAVLYGFAELALPFTDNLVEGGAGMLSRLIERHGGDVASRFGSLGASGGFAQASGLLERLIEPLGGVVDHVGKQTSAIARRLQSISPSAATIASVADSATGAAATAVDALPVWRFLGGRLVAEACVVRAAQSA